jgi:hypothetical protein
VFASGNAVILAIRAAGCLAVYLLAERLGRAAWAPSPPAVALVAVLVFAANPAFAFFDAQFAYESLASPLVAVVVLTAARLGDHGPRWGPRRRGEWCCARSSSSPITARRIC